MSIKKISLSLFVLLAISLPAFAAPDPPLPAAFRNVKLIETPDPAPQITRTIGALQYQFSDSTWHFVINGLDTTYSSGGGGGGVTSIATTSPIGGGTITTTGTLTCATCVVASSPGAGIAHFAGSTQTVTSSAVALASDVSGNLPIGNLNSGTSASSSTFWRGDGTWAVPSGTGNTTSTSLTTSKVPKANGANSIIDSSITDNGTTVSIAEPLTTTGSLTTGSGCTPAGSTATGGVCMTEAASTGWTPTAGYGYDRMDSTIHHDMCSWNNGAETACNPAIPSSWTSGHVISAGTWPSQADSGLVAANLVVASSPGAGIAHFAGSTQTVTSSAVVGADMTNATVTATQLAAQYSKGACTELWGGSGTSFALTSGDDAISNNSCYNDSGVTRTITAVKCRSDNGSNTTTVNPTFGSAGTGTTILSGALTCGSSLAYSSSGTVSNASWTTGAGITPAMSGTLTGTSIAMIVEYTF